MSSEKKTFSERKNILWVDDDVNKPALEPDREEIDSRNCIIIEAAKPAEFLKIINEGAYKIDGIIIDISMRIGNSLSIEETRNGTRTGLALVKRLKESQNYKDVPIVVYTVIDDDDVISYCEENEIPYLKKSDDSIEDVNMIVGEFIRLLTPNDAVE